MYILQFEELIDRVELWSTWSEPPTEPHDFHGESDQLFSCLDKMEQGSRLEAARQKSKIKHLNEEKMRNKRQQQRQLADGLITSFTEQIRR